jgi:hypothetical protein
MLTDERLKEIKYRHIEEGLCAGANGAIFELIAEIERIRAKSSEQQEPGNLEAAINCLKKIAYGHYQTWVNCSSREEAKKVLKELGVEEQKCK